MEFVTVLVPLMTTGAGELVIHTVGEIRLVADSKEEAMPVVGHVKTTFVPARVINNSTGLAESEILKMVPPPLKPVPLPPATAVP